MFSARSNLYVACRNVRKKWEQQALYIQWEKVAANTSSPPLAVHLAPRFVSWYITQDLRNSALCLAILLQFALLFFIQLAPRSRAAEPSWPPLRSAGSKCVSLGFLVASNGIAYHWWQVQAGHLCSPGNGGVLTGVKRTVTCKKIVFIYRVLGKLSNSRQLSWN